MMAKLNGASTLPEEAQKFLGSYRALLDKMTEPEATDATIGDIYRNYYAEMGGTGVAPDVSLHPAHPVTDNVTPFKRPPARPKAKAGPDGKPRLPVALIFAGLVVVYVGVRYFWP